MSNITLKTPADGYAAIIQILAAYDKNNNARPVTSYSDIDFDNIDLSVADEATLKEYDNFSDNLLNANDFTVTVARALLRIGAAVNDADVTGAISHFEYRLTEGDTPWRAYEAALKLYGCTWFADPRSMLLSAGDAGMYWAVEQVFS